MLNLMKPILLCKHRSKLLLSFCKEKYDIYYVHEPQLSLLGQLEGEVDLLHVEPHGGVLHAAVALIFCDNTVKRQPIAVIKWYQCAVDGEFHISQIMLSKF